MKRFEPRLAVALGVNSNGSPTMKQKEFNVDDFVAGEGGGFLVEVKDAEGNLVNSAQLKVTVDGGDEQTIDAESDGTFKVTPQPQDTLKISEVIGGN